MTKVSGNVARAVVFLAALQNGKAGYAHAELTYSRLLPGRNYAQKNKKWNCKGILFI